MRIAQVHRHRRMFLPSGGPRAAELATARGGVLEDPRVSPLRYRSRDRGRGGGGEVHPSPHGLCSHPCAGPSLGDGPGQRNSRFPHGSGAGIPQGFTSMRKAKLCTKWCVSKPTCIFLTTTSAASIRRSEGPLGGPRTDRSPVLSVAPNRQHFRPFFSHTAVARPW